MEKEFVKFVVESLQHNQEGINLIVETLPKIFETTAQIQTFTLILLIITGLNSIILLSNFCLNFFTFYFARQAIQREVLFSGPGRKEQSPGPGKPSPDLECLKPGAGEP